MSTVKNRLRARSINEKTPNSNVKLKICMESVEMVRSPSNNVTESLRTPKTSRKKTISSPPSRMSERRRSLFKKKELNEENLQVDLFDDVQPLSPISKPINSINLRSSVKKPFEENSNLYNTTHCIIKTTGTNRRNTCTEELQKMFNNVNICNSKVNNLNDSIQEAVYVDENCNNEKRKRHTTAFESLLNSKKRAKIRLEVSSPELQISTKNFYSRNELKNNKEIGKNSDLLNLSPTVLNMISESFASKNHSKKKKSKPPGSNANFLKLANKGVGHKVRKPFLKNKQNKKSVSDFLKTITCEKLRSLPSKRISPEKVKEVHNILKNTANSIELARPLIINCDEEICSKFSDSDDSEIDEIETNDIVSNNKHQAILSNLPMQLQKENLSISVQKNNESSSPLKIKKFFKSGHSSAKEIRITDNIKLGVSCGKMSLLSEKKKKYKSQSKSFLNEQAVVNDIIKNLTISPEKNDDFNSPTEPAMDCLQTANITSLNILDEKIIDEVNDDISIISNTLKLQDDLCKEFRTRIPYRTTDSNEIERQHLLLDFLITNNICTEKNFEIFIADPDNHKDEADEIINNMVEIVNDDTYTMMEDLNLDPYDHFRNQIPYNTNDPFRAKEQAILLDFLIENNICTEKNFTIFIKELETRKDEAEKIIESVSSLVQIENTTNQESTKTKEIDVESSNATKEINVEKQKLYPIFYSGKRYFPIKNKFSRDKKHKKIWRGAMGADQYQIDAGQKEFGAKQCSKCGLVYTVHEPEEEIIHKEYHDSMYFLKFRGWIDEDVVGKYFEWSNDGRIIRVSSSEHAKKRERLMELLKIVDKELGFASYILPDVYTAFLAIRKTQIVGLCLIQYLSKANRYVKINGVDCCTEECFDAKIGVSRIWVSPLCRRMGIASKLLLAARSHAIVGDVIDNDKIAFSAPTEDGKVFAQKMSKRTDFLVYQ